MIERKWLVAIVVISIALNLLLVGFYIGRQPLLSRTNLVVDPTMSLPRILQGLPDDRRRALLRDVNVSRRQIASRYRALQKVQVDIERVMATEPFDAERLAQALENFRRRFD
ncbi:MAG TPA: periplasmic heavy metal sensor, partial [Pseudomonadales bacterium]|nr:periplasmic heavy metal sensor [Pseudomonadales bacterium]